MNCIQVLHHIDSYVRNETTPILSKDIAEHIEICESCRAEAEFAKEIATKIKFLKARASETLVKKTLSKAQQKRIAWFTPMRAIAASLLIGAVIYLSSEGRKLLTEDTFKEVTQSARPNSEDKSLELEQAIELNTTPSENRTKNISEHNEAANSNNSLSSSEKGSSARRIRFSSTEPEQENKFESPSEEAMPAPQPAIPSTPGSLSEPASTSTLRSSSPTMLGGGTSYIPSASRPIYGSSDEPNELGKSISFERTFVDSSPRNMETLGDTHVSDSKKVIDKLDEK